MIDFENRMYGYEDEERLDKTKYSVVRLDGVKFSNLTKKFFRKPYDESFQQHMYHTAYVLKERFAFDAVFVISDEITCLWKPFEDHQDIPFGGRIQKIVSMVSGYSSSFFTSRGWKTFPMSYFDARTYNVPDIHEATNVFYWRAKNGYRNAVGGWAYHTYGHKYCQNKSVKEMEKEIPQSFKDGNLEFFYGFFVGKGVYNLLQTTHDERIDFIWKS